MVDVPLTVGRGRRRKPTSLPLAAAIAIAAYLSTPSPASAQTPAGSLGATLDGLLEAGRGLSPELRAAVLDVEAAAARADAAGALDDPTFRVLSDEVDRTGGARINKTYVSVEQDFPLWGKRDLRRSMALAEVDAARGRERAAAAALDERLKVAFARYWASGQALLINADVVRLGEQMTRAATARYGQAVGSQRDAIMARTEIIQAEAEVVQLEREHRSAAARINALLARGADAPLAEPRSARALPTVIPVLGMLVERARAGNPQLYAGGAAVRGAETERQLARKAWYPDVTLGAGAIQRDNGPAGFTATIGFKIPLQSGAKEAGEREAAAKLRAARERLAQVDADIQGDLGEQLAQLGASRRVAGITRDRLEPQLAAAYQSALADYGPGRGDLATVLDAEHRLHQTRLNLLRIELDEQTAVAAVERLIGGDL